LTRCQNDGHTVWTEAMRRIASFSSGLARSRGSWISAKMWMSTGVTCVWRHVDLIQSVAAAAAAVATSACKSNLHGSACHSSIRTNKAAVEEIAWTFRSLRVALKDGFRWRRGEIGRRASRCQQQSSATLWRVARGFQTVCGRRLKTTLFSCVFNSDSVMPLNLLVELLC